MGQRLKSREKQIPNGFFFRQPEISWDSKKVLGMHPSFSTLVNSVISARKANPHHATKHKWSLDPATVANEVEAFQVRVCQSMGWSNYLTDAGGSAVPFSSQSLLSPSQLGAAAKGVQKLWKGIKTLNDFLDSGEPPVAPELAESRAAVCVQCSHNGKGDFSAWFTKPAAAAITRQLEKLQQRKISTTKDDQINICNICLCPLKLKVQTPMKFIKDQLDAEMINELSLANEKCWIPIEAKAGS